HGGFRQCRTCVTHPPRRLRGYCEQTGAKPPRNPRRLTCPVQAEASDHTPMPITVSLHHRTRYSYDRPVKLAPHVLRLRPAPHCRTPIHAYSLKVTPARHFVNWLQDPFGNYQARLVFPHEASALEIDVALTAEL